MKYILKITLFILLFNFSNDVISQQNLNGVWKDSSGVQFKNCYLIIAQEDSIVNMIHYLEYNGIPMVEYGKGTFVNDSVVYEVTVSQAVPGWSTKGIHKLVISKDGKKLSGMFFDNKGNEGRIVFIKQFIKEK